MYSFAFRRLLGARAPTLTLVGGSFLSLVIYAQLSSQATPWPWESPTDLSTGVLAVMGLAWALVQALIAWNARSAYTHWLVGTVGLGLIWAAETAVDEFPAFDFRWVILVWSVAAVAVVYCVHPYAVRVGVRVAVRAGVTGQCVAHGVWLLDDAFLDPASVFHPWLELTTDAGELLALLGYLSALLLARFSGFDEHARNAARLAGLNSAGLPADRVRVCFVYIAQLHQVLHSLPIAAAAAKRHPQLEVHVAALGNKHLGFIRRLVRRHAGETPLHYDHLVIPLPARILHRFFGRGLKKRALLANRHYFAGFDAIVTPERTSTFLKKLGIARLRLIGTEHGAGDREVTFAPETALYDFLLLPGDKQAQRLETLRRIEPRRIWPGVYAKYDWTIATSASRLRLFDNDRPTVVYNPHFDPRLSSWPVFGWSILEWFARSEHYNLIFAPHMRLFDRATWRSRAAFRELRRRAHLHIDLGSERSVDMSYTLAADLYLGDVSSQVVEFLMRPRPCAFLNAHRVDWQDDPHYRFWRLGPVIEDLAELGELLRLADAQHRHYLPLQHDYLRETLGTAMRGGNAERGADAIFNYLRGCA